MAATTGDPTQPRRLILAGPGRAGLSLGMALVAAGHEIVGLLARSDPDPILAAERLGWDAPLPPADLLLVAVRDDAIEEVASRLAPVSGQVEAAVHLSGLKPVGALGPLADAGLVIGAFHPLQTLPDPDAGAARLAGSWAGVTASSPTLHDLLFGLAASIGVHPFDLPDEARAVYHAGCAAAANYVAASLAMAEALFAAAEVPFEAARPLVRAVVENAFDLGPAKALTGPIARGDVDTVAAQRQAVESLAPEWAEGFVAWARAVARFSGREGEFDEVLA